MTPAATAMLKQKRAPRRLPRPGGELFLSDGGLETTLIYHEGFDLPMFAAFVLLDSAHGRAALERYYDRYGEMAARRGLGLILETPTWRANPDWGAQLRYDLAELARINRDAVALMETLRDRYETDASPVLVSGNIGPRGDGYDPGRIMNVQQAQDYHGWQVGVFRDAGVDMVTAMTLTNSNEAIGVARAAQAAGMACVIAFTLETDGRLPTGETLRDAIAAVDASVERQPIYYMVNCAHPSHFAHIFKDGEAWIERLGAIRANASRRSHAELDCATELDAGDPAELGELYADLRRHVPGLCALGGCCGTDHRHIDAIAATCTGKD